MKREVALAVAVGALAGLLGAWSARRSTDEAKRAPEAAEGEAPAADAPVHAAVERRVDPRPQPSALLRVQVKPPAALPLRLARWSLRPGKGSDGDWLELPAAATDASGRAELKLQPGTYWVGAGVVHGQIDVFRVTDLELELQRGERLTGRVLGAGTERPIAGALVVASPDDEAPESEKQTAQTDGLGRFVFESVPKGQIQLDVSAAGWAASGATAEAPGAVDVHLEAACRVDGVVVDGEGAAVGGVRDTDPATIAGPEGRFWLELECGAGHTLVARDANGRVGLAKLEPGQRTVTLRLEPGLTLAGTVRTSSGEPVAGAEVAAMIGDDEVRARAVSDERGTFTLSALTPASYVVRARKGRGTAGAVYGFEVPASAPIELVVEPGAVLEGEVLGADDPVAVELEWSALMHQRAARTQTLGGRFRFEDLPAGAVKVAATVPGRSSDLRVLLAPGSVQSVRLELEAHGRIVGRVTGPGAARAVVGAFRRSREGDLSRTAPVAADGTFALEVPAGEYSVGASSGSRMMLRFDTTAFVKAGEDSSVELVLAVTDGGTGWGPMASVARGELGGSFENVNGSVQVSWVVADSPLSAAGLKVGDVLTAIDGKPVSNALDAFARTRGAPGAVVALTWRRDGVERTADVARAP